MFVLEEYGEGLADDKLQCGPAFGCIGLGLPLLLALHAGIKELGYVLEVVFVGGSGSGQERFIVVVISISALPFGKQLVNLMLGEEFHCVGGTLQDGQVACDVDEVAAGLDAVDDVNGLSLAFEGYLSCFAGGAHCLNYQFSIVVVFGVWFVGADDR